MKFFKFLWTIIWNLFVVLVTIGVLDGMSYEGGIQKVTALAFIILATVQTSSATQLRISTIFAITSQVRDAKILRHLGNTEEAEYLEEDSKILEEKIKANEVKFRINIVGGSLIYIIALLTLLS